MSMKVISANHSRRAVFSLHSTDVNTERGGEGGSDPKLTCYNNNCTAPIHQTCSKCAPPKKETHKQQFAKLSSLSIQTEEQSQTKVK